MTTPSLVEPLTRQFAAAHQMLREAIALCPPEHWRSAPHPFFIPARLAFHIVQAQDFHLDPAPKSFNWSRFGFDWEETAPEHLLDQPSLLAYLDEVIAKTNRRLLEIDPLGPDYAGFFPTALDHILYTLRHTQHHTGQINAQLKSRNLKPARWR